MAISNNMRGLILAVMSSTFIGASFILKKKGLKRAGASGARAAFLFYSAATLSIVLILVLHFEPRYGQTNILVYLGICPLMGPLTLQSSVSSLN